MVERGSKQGLFVGVGVDLYTSPDLTSLPGSADEVQMVAELVGEHFDVDILRDPCHAAIHRVLRERAGHFSADEGAMVLMWSGHGIPGVGANSLKLLAHDSRNEPSEGFDPLDVATRCAATGAHQILLIIDTCYSGNAVDTVAHIAKYFRENPPMGQWSWFGVLAACGPEKVRQRQLGPQLARLLREGPHPQGPYVDDLRRRWSTHQRFLRGDDLCDALIKQRDPDAPSVPEFTSTGDARPFLRNPLWSPATGPLLVDEVLTGVPTRSTFYGRQAAVATVVRWLTEQRCGVYVVSGAAGSGKSALLRHALPLLKEDPTGPPAAAVLVDVHGLSVDVITTALDAALVAQGTLDPAPIPRNTSELCSSLQRRRDSGEPVPVIALDALAGATDPGLVVQALLTPLSAVATVIVATRPAAIAVPRQRRASPFTLVAAAGETEDLISIAAALASSERILDLDSAQHRRSGWDALVDMLDAEVSRETPDRDPAGAVAALRRHAGEESPPPFVLTKLLLDEARRTGVGEPFAAGTAEESLGAAIDHTVTRAYDAAALPAARVLLRALAHGLGAGFPEREWLLAANAVRATDVAPLGRVDVAATLAPLGAYIVEDSESDEAVYRFAHSLIAQHFAADGGTAGSATMDIRIAAALVADLRQASGTRSAHLERYLWRYAAGAGVRGLDLLRGNDSLSTDLAAAALAVSIGEVAGGNLGAAVGLAEEAVSVAEGLSDAGRGWRLAPALAHLATLYQSLGRVTRAVQAGYRAVAAYNELVGEHPEVVADLAAVAHNLANMLMDAQDAAASGVAAQAVDLEERFQPLGTDNRYRLGIARNTLALSLSMEGRIAEAVEKSRGAVEVLQAAVNDTGTERDRAALAQALQNLGSHLAGHGDLSEAVTVTERARDIMEALVASDTTWVPGLLETLSDLGARYSQIGRAEEAVATASRAVDGYRAIRPLSSGQTVNYAGALTNKANVLIIVDRAEAATGPAREAVEIMRGLADREEAKRPALAQMLDNYANALSLTGRHGEALEASAQALQYFRAARGGNAGLDNDVARALQNHCQRLAATAQFASAVEAGTEAISLFERLSADEPRNQVYAVTTRALVAIFTVAAGDETQGGLLAAQACERGEQLLTTGLMSAVELATIYVEATKAVQSDPATAMRYAQRTVDLLRQAGSTDTSTYATALRNLAACHGMAGQFAAGLTVVAEAVAVWTRLLDLDSSHRGGLASALSTMASLQLEQRDVTAARDTAVAAVEHYGMIPELHPHDIETCGRTLATLARALGDDIDRLDQHVDRCLRSRDGVTRAQLLYFGVTVLPVDHPRVPHWLHTAMNELGSESPMLLLLQLRRTTRTFRAANRVRFDQRWRHATGTNLPAWAMIDELKIGLAMRWISAPDYTAAETFLRDNPQLLGADFDSPINEAFLVLDSTRAATLAEIRDQIRFSGSTDTPGGDSSDNTRAVDGQVKDVVAPNVYDVAERFLDADLGGRIALLAAHGEQLRSDPVRRHLLARTDHTRLNSAVSLVEISRLALHTAVATAAASRDGDPIDNLLALIADDHDPKTLRQAAFVVMDIASTAADITVAAVTSFYLGVSLLGTENDTQGRELISAATDNAPERIPMWQELSARLAPKTPEFAEAAAILGQHAGGDGG